MSSELKKEAESLVQQKESFGGGAGVEPLPGDEAANPPCCKFSVYTTPSVDHSVC